MRHRPSCGRSKNRLNARYRRLTSPDGNLFQQQKANRRRTTWLVIGFVLFFAWLGFGGDLIFYLSTARETPWENEHYRHVVPWFGIALTLIGMIVARYAYRTDRKSTRLNSSHLGISYAVFCLKKKNKKTLHDTQT